MELRQLRYFVKIAELLSFSEASKALFVTQSTLSQQLKQLEQELGCTLLERSSHNVRLTEAGCELLPMATAMLRESELCFDKIRDLSDLNSGTLNIGVTYSFASILTGTLNEFMSKYPCVRLNIYCKPVRELMDMLCRREVDFVLAFRPDTLSQEIDSHTIFQNYLAVIVADNHELATRSTVSIADLEDYDLVLPVKGMQARNALDSVLGNDLSRLRVRAELNEINILLDMVRRLGMASVLAEATIHEEKGVKAVRLVCQGGEMNGCVHTLKGAYRKHSLQEFLRLLSHSEAVIERQNEWI